MAGAPTASVGGTESAIVRLLEFYRFARRLSHKAFRGKLRRGGCNAPWSW